MGGQAGASAAVRRCDEQGEHGVSLGDDRVLVACRPARSSTGRAAARSPVFHSLWRSPGGITMQSPTATSRSCVAQAHAGAPRRPRSRAPPCARGSARRSRRPAGTVASARLWFAAGVHAGPTSSRISRAVLGGERLERRERARRAPRQRGHGCRSARPHAPRTRTTTGSPPRGLSVGIWRTLSV